MIANGLQNETPLLYYNLPPTIHTSLWRYITTYGMLLGSIFWWSQIVKERQMEFDVETDPDTMYELFGEDYVSFAE